MGLFERVMGLFTHTCMSNRNGRWFWYRIPVFGVDLLLHIGESDNKSLRFGLQDWIDSKLASEINSHSNGDYWCSGLADNVIACHVYLDKRNGANVDTLSGMAHELLHASSFVLERCGVREAIDGNDECFLHVFSDLYLFGLSSLAQMSCGKLTIKL